MTLLRAATASSIELIEDVRTTFGLPPTGDPEFIYRLLGGRIDRAAAWMAVIDENGDVTYGSADGR